MTRRRLRAVLLAGTASAALWLPAEPVRADWIVFDPHYFAQNVLTAARELQQVNNEIQSLENQATMLINQARNLASLPCSALSQLEQSIAQTQQLLAQAQNIAYSITSINQAFATTLPTELPGLDLGAAADRGGADAERPGRAAEVFLRSPTPPSIQDHATSWQESGRRLSTEVQLNLFL
jgi:hypothetical protein